MTQCLSAHCFAAENAIHVRPSLPRLLGDESLLPDQSQGLVGHIIGQEESHSPQMFNDGMTNDQMGEKSTDDGLRCEA